MIKKLGEIIMIYFAADHAGFELKQALISSSYDHKIQDLGTFSTDPVDYPDLAKLMAEALAANSKAQGILICGSGIGISMAANRFSHIRAALCRNEEDATLARQHNDANVLVLGGRITDLHQAKKIIDSFLQTKFEQGRHSARVEKMTTNKDLFFSTGLAQSDNEIASIIQKELIRQKEGIELIASENLVSKAVLEAQGSVMTNKYAEGYIGKRYYAGCEYIDEAEKLAIERAKKLFHANFVNVQPHSGSQANQAVFAALLQPGDTFLGMSLDSGGHLTHGSKVNLSGKWFNPVSYTVHPQTGLIDMDLVAKLAKEHWPKLIIAGGSAYPRSIDFKAFREIADQVGAYLMVDMAHFAGLVATGHFPSPIPHAHVITTTTHKTLRGPRGGMILSNDEEIAKKINSAIFPGMQGGPLMHIIAAKAVAFKEALAPSFKDYIGNVVENARTLGKTLQSRGYQIFTGGTDCHLLLVDLRPQKLTGKAAEESLNRAGLICNKNAIPFDTEKPFITSGIRVGSPASTTRGFMQKEFTEVAHLIAEVLDGLQKNHENNSEAENEVHRKVMELCQSFPIYGGLTYV
jgi:glycine hydroxymethyltransferase